MSYGEKYRLEYRDQLIEGETGRLTTVKILKRDYLGSVTEVNGSANPVRFSGKTDEDYLFSQLVSTSCDISLLSSYSFQFRDLFSADLKEHKVEVWKEPTPGATQELFWTGWVLPDTYIEPLHYDKDYPVRVTCIDGIGRLKDAKLKDDNGNRYEGKVTLSSAVKTIIDKVGYELPFKYALSFNEIYTTVQANNSIFHHIYIDWETFYLKDKDVKCDYALKQILQAFGARIKQSKGCWIIEEVTKNSAQHARITDTLTTEIYNPVRAYTGKDDRTANRLFFENRGGDLSTDPAYKEFTVYHDFLKRNSIIKNNSFEKWFEIQPPSGLPSDFGNYSFEYWTKTPINGTFVRPGKYTDSDEYYMGMKGYYAAFNTTEYIQSAPIAIKLNSRPAYFSLDVRRYLFSTYVEIKIGSKWVGEDGDLVDSVYRHHINLVTKANFETFEISVNEITPINYDGDLIVRIYRPYYGAIPNTGVRPFFHVDNVTFKYTDVDSNAKDIRFTVDVNKDNNHIPNEVQSILGDVPDILDREDIYAGTFWRLSGGNYIPTLLWSSTGQAQNTTILQCLAELINDNYYKPKDYLTGLNIKGNFDFDSCIQVNFLDDKKYVPVHWDCDDKYCSWVVDAVEIVGSRVLGTETGDDFLVTEDNDYILL